MNLMYQAWLEDKDLAKLYAVHNFHKSFTSYAEIFFSTFDQPSIYSRYSYFNTWLDSVHLYIASIEVEFRFHYSQTRLQQIQTPFHFTDIPPHRLA